MKLITGGFCFKLFGTKLNLKFPQFSAGILNQLRGMPAEMWYYPLPQPVRLQVLEAFQVSSQVSNTVRLHAPSKVKLTFPVKSV